MSDYTKTVDFAAKDALASGNAAKVAKGTEIDTEFDNIATAIATKYDSTDRGAANGIAPLDSGALVPVVNLPQATTTAIGASELATSAETLTGTDTARVVTPSGLQAVLDAGAGFLNDIKSITDPGEDRMLFWDDSDGAIETLVPGTGLAITTNTLATVDSEIVHDNLSGFVANEHIDHSGVSITGGNGMSGGGSITTSRAIDMRTPATLTATSTNSASAGTGHSHAAGAGIVRTHSDIGGEITVSTSAASGAATNGDLWLQV